MRKLAPVAALAAAALACAPSAAWAAAGGSVNPTPASFTPSIATTSTDGSTELIRQLTPCGSSMYAVGRFTSIKQGGATYSRNNVFSFDATTGAMTSFAPNVNGQVNSIALSADCSRAYLGGSFTAVGAATVSNLAEVSVSTGAVVAGFASSAGNKVNNLLLTGNHLLVGGQFSSLNGSTKKYLVSVNPSTGQDDGYVNLNISGNYVFTMDNGVHSGSNPTNVYNMELSHSGTRALVMGDFTSVGGVGRRQIFMLDLGATAATVDSWYSKEFNQNCNYNEAFWLQAASWSPDDSTVYTAATGYKPASDHDSASGVTSGFGTTEPRGGLCDAAAAFSTSITASTLVPNHKWVQYTGCDSLYSTAVDPVDGSVYVGGHHRWLDNPLGCDTYLTAGATRVTDPGLGGLDPATGHAYTTSNQFQGKYVRSRGTGADDEIVTAQGLWIASDNGISSGNSTTCGGVSGHAGLCLLPH